MGLMLPQSHSCFVCGVANPLGLNLAFEVDGATVMARFRPRPEHAGFKRTVHGGLIATVLDEAMVWACGAATGRFAYCAELNVRFQRPLPTETDSRVIGQLVANRRNRLFAAKAVLLTASGGVLASATGKYIPIPANMVAEMRSDFVEDVNAAVARCREIT